MGIDQTGCRHADAQHVIRRGAERLDEFIDDGEHVIAVDAGGSLGGARFDLALEVQTRRAELVAAQVDGDEVAAVAVDG